MNLDEQIVCLRFGCAITARRTRPGVAVIDRQAIRAPAPDFSLSAGVKWFLVVAVAADMLDDGNSEEMERVVLSRTNVFCEADTESYFAFGCVMMLPPVGPTGLAGDTLPLLSRLATPVFISEQTTIVFACEGSLRPFAVDESEREVSQRVVLHLFGSFYDLSGLGAFGR